MRATEARALAAGHWWDGIRVPLELGLRTLGLLGESTGAVVRDGYGAILYWLVAPGTAADWNLPEVAVLGRGCHVVFPPPLRVNGPGLYWQVPLARNRDRTSAPLLHAALTASLESSAREGAVPGV
ncbi:hypothetical protein [Streptomyces mangrovisoli]|uniref:hypothetical protein n=1 Tax=Streptomyces mangrovisoli TaxID=1428628 RepID=UPI001F0B4FD4|nr:hypothetical protein [Streptomyces mangrovisoli]